MKPEKVFKRYDIRGKYPEEIDEEFAKRLGRSLGKFIHERDSKDVVVGRDTKNSSREIKRALVDGLEKSGINVLDAGEGPTDFVAFTGMKNSACSVQVTASHLPLENTGFKMIYPEGNSFVNEDLETVRKIFREENFVEGAGRTSRIAAEARKNYKNDIIRFTRKHVDSFDQEIVIDSLGGATSGLMKDVLEELGAKVEEIERDKPPNPPDPEPDRLEEMERECRESGSTGFASDMDGDRLSVFSDGWVTGDRVMAVLSALFDSDVVASIDTCLVTEKFIRTQDRSVRYTRVGDPFVLEKALKEDVEIAGEPNGHYCFPGFVPYNSGILAAALLAGTDVDSCLKKLPEYTSVRSSIHVDRKEEVMDKLEDHVAKHHRITSRKDGIEFRMGDTRVLARPSGTSSKIRLKAGCVKGEMAEKAVEEIEDFIRKQ